MVIKRFFTVEIGILYESIFLASDTLFNQEQGRNEQGAGASGQGQSSRSQGRSQGQGQGGGGGDDREGFLVHPTKGRVPTYIFYVSIQIT